MYAARAMPRLLRLSLLLVVLVLVAVVVLLLYTCVEPDAALSAQIPHEADRN
jgi:hypothetical protein